MASFGHAQLNTGASRMMNRALIDWNHTYRNFEITDHAIGVVVGKQVKGSRFLFKRGPEERSGNQQDKANQQSGALFTGQAREDEQINKVERNGCRNHIDQHTYHRDRVNHNDPWAISVTRTATPTASASSHAPTPLRLTTGLFQVESRPTSLS